MADANPPSHDPLRRCLLDSCSQWIPESEFLQHMTDHFPDALAADEDWVDPDGEEVDDVGVEHTGEWKKCLLESCGQMVPAYEFEDHMKDHFADAASSAAIIEQPHSANTEQLVPCLLEECHEMIQASLLEDHLRAHFDPPSHSHDDQPPAATTISITSVSRRFRTCFMANCGKKISCDLFAAHVEEHLSEKISEFVVSDTNMMQCIMEYCKKMVPASEFASHVQQHIAEDEATLNCPSCMLDYPVGDMYTFNCSGNHRFCRELCVNRLVEMAASANTRLTCPMCHDVIHEDEISVLLGKDHPFAQKYGGLELQSLLDSAPDTFMHCPTPNCPGVVELPSYLATSRHRVRCPCCGAEYCSLCRQAPYHYDTTCPEANWVRAKWAALSILLAKGTAQRYVKEQEDKLKQYEILRKDEEAKANNCVLCPRCKRVIERIEGCDSMVCGQDAHGGNIQNGCGYHFDWGLAKKHSPYVAQFPPPPRPDNIVAELESDFHHAECYPCHFCTQRIVGVRFECLNCPDRFSVCRKCVEQIFPMHPAKHSFLIRLRDEDTQGSMRQDWRRRFLKMLMKYEPKSSEAEYNQAADWIMAQHVGREARAMELMVSQYGPEPLPTKPPEEPGPPKHPPPPPKVPITKKIPPPRPRPKPRGGKRRMEWIHEQIRKISKHGADE